MDGHSGDTDTLAHEERVLGGELAWRVPGQGRARLSRAPCGPATAAAPVVGAWPRPCAGHA